MKPVAIVIDDLFDDDEYNEAVRVLRKAGRGSITVGITPNWVAKGLPGGTEVRIERDADQLKPGHISALYIPGGTAAERLIDHPRVLRLVRSCVEEGVPVFAVAEGITLLDEAGVLENRQTAAPESAVERLRRHGARPVDAPVVSDGPVRTTAAGCHTSALLAPLTGGGAG